MESKNQWRLLIGFISALLLIIPIITLILYPPNTFLIFLVRWAALWGFIGLALTSIMNMNKKILFQKFGLKFMKLHHTLAVFSLIMATLHPVAFALDSLSLLVFIPNFATWLRFWELAGRPALILIYIGVVAAIFRKRLPTSWRYFHYLLYLALIFIFVHGILIGTDFQSVLILITFSLLILGVVVTFILLRIEKYRRNQKKKNRASNGNKN